MGQMYQCRAQHRGALLSLPHKGHRKDVIPKKVFEDYIRDNVDKWFRWSKKMKLPHRAHGRPHSCYWVYFGYIVGCCSVRWPHVSGLGRHDNIFGGQKVRWRQSTIFLAQHSWKRRISQQSFRPSSFPRLCLLAVNLCFLHRTRVFKSLYLRTNASLSGVFVQSALSSGPYQCGLQQNPFLTTLTIIGRMRYK